MSTHWPPIIGSAHVPWWARLRDLVLTLLAWAALLYALSPLWLAPWADLRGGADSWQVRGTPHVDYAWQVMRPFLQLAALFALWLVSFALVRRHRYLTKHRALHQPPALGRQEQVARSGVPPELAGQLLEQRLSVVRFAEHGRPSDVSTKA